MTSEILSILERTPATLRGLLAHMTPEDLAWQPSPDRWSITMVLAHLADVEVKGFSLRFTPIATLDNPFLPAYDQLELFRAGRRFDAGAELANFEARRAETLAFLKALPDSARTRIGRHEQLGVITFDQLLHEFAFHDLGHIRQIVELYRSHAFYPHMGAFQSYYKINP